MYFSSEPRAFSHDTNFPTVEYQRPVYDKAAGAPREPLMPDESIARKRGEIKA